MSGPGEQPPPAAPLTDPGAEHLPHDVDVRLRRRAAYFYGLIVSGAVLAADPDSVRLWVVGVALLGTVLVYWVAETYVHWVAARTTHQRALTGAERHEVVWDGFPLVAACLVPAIVLFVEAVFSVETAVAVRVALCANVVLLVGVGWRMAPAGVSAPMRRLVFATMTGVLGVLMIGLKTLLH
jgi:hypothetical protein